MERNKREELLSRLPFWGDLSPMQKQRSIDASRIIEFKKGTPVHNCCCGQGECLGLLLIQTGSVRTFILSQEGREVTIFRLFAGDVCLFSASCVIKQITFDTHIVAEEDTTALIFSAGMLADLIRENLAVERYIYTSAVERFSEVMQVFQNLLFMSLEQRIANFLREESNRTKSSEIRLTHEQVAKHTGSAREAVTRTLKGFAEEGVVELKRGKIVITDPDALSDICG
ncbi:MAG: Crp/Fnr family transcriptional regulator [Oscillospiraceae bacterium]|nr:Crp/Fnr family transcriptional regulator [Oscillospiraceae bacterium]